MSGSLVFAGFLIFIAVCILGAENDLGSVGSTITGAVGSLEAVVTGNLSASQIASYAQAAGFTGPDLITAVAIALAESGGNPSALGDVNISPGGSIGLWQINVAAHPEFSGENLYDPQTNANAAYSVFVDAGDSFSPWSTYSNGAYESFLATAQGAVSA